jgi:hypothetical protein
MKEKKGNWKIAGWDNQIILVWNFAFTWHFFLIKMSQEKLRKESLDGIENEEIRVNK